ncbi:hypothetical protein KPSA1_03976 [Pseudomonas syringae pv. actinidiae]|uniref:Uncharacterized protein n=1 Tax=Pseudomonas syringae pv. actinidiae TaxID=103796 RepID=A0A2V0QCX1_PSESF|nr:hypothetical protein KPSA1_03976 [Pseudomonas syringae pv. actinidiae]
MAGSAKPLNNHDPGPICSSCRGWGGLVGKQVQSGGNVTFALHDRVEHLAVSCALLNQRSV